MPNTRPWKKENRPAEDVQLGAATTYGRSRFVLRDLAAAYVRERWKKKPSFWRETHTEKHHHPACRREFRSSCHRDVRGVVSLGSGKHQHITVAVPTSTLHGLHHMASRELSVFIQQAAAAPERAMCI
ncbi:hypothetical protein LR48_Vigan03g188500 [Vigna angularis]|uniref:Uncharacterized protein n=1 Tax=Phaseolus angularis TaxID=3914 RepID=A0A0L9U6T4_PHAAN|nr:hypothetical protein LR48_Vigan03g188500 [Vigna angularis]